MYRLFNNRLFEHAQHDYENVFLKSLRDLGTYRVPLKEASILILGCGYNYPDVILYSDIFKYVVGLDTRRAFYRDGVIRLYKNLAQNNKIKAALRSVELCFYYSNYYRYLKKLSGKEIKHKEYILKSYDGDQIPFGDESFDVVLSNAVIEHIVNLDHLFKEICRVTKKDGYSYHLWHNYYSFSGGHLPNSMCFKNPWGHLRNIYITKDLNKLKPDQLKEMFSKYFEITAMYQVDRSHRKRGYGEGFEFEHEELLSGGLKDELKEYQPDILLTRAYLIIGKRLYSHLV